MPGFHGPKMGPKMPKKKKAKAPMMGATPKAKAPVAPQALGGSYRKVGY